MHHGDNARIGPSLPCVKVIIFAAGYKSLRRKRSDEVSSPGATDEHGSYSRFRLSASMAPRAGEDSPRLWVEKAPQAVGIDEGQRPKQCATG
jgi:hypothetical protein